MIKQKKASPYLLLIWTLATGVQTRSQYQQAGAESTRDRVLLADIKVLTLYQSRQTAGRRSAPLPQLVCQGGCGHVTPNMVQCYNMGSDGIDAAWKCEASMPEGYGFLSIEVGCEGYDYPEDPYILKDSCQLVYSLSVPRQEQGWSRGPGGDNRDFSSRLVTWAVLGIIGYVLYNVLINVNHNDLSRPPPPSPGGNDGGWGSGGWGGGGGDNWRGSRPSDPYTKNASTAAPAPAGNGWVSTLAAGGIGAALGYMLRPRQPRYAGGGFNMNRGYGGGTFGGGAGTYRRQTGVGSGGGGSGGMRMRAGYGGTSRR